MLILGESLIILRTFCLMLMIPCICAEFSVDDQNVPLSFNFSKKEEIELYFNIKRKQQLEAVKTLLGFSRYEQKYEMMRRIFEKLFDVIENSRSKVENSEYILGDELPKSPVVEHILQIMENCAFFGNLVLKLPDISDRLLSTNNQWVDSYKWCFTFSISSNLLDEYSLKMFNLAAQQLGLIPKSANFTNPYQMTNKKTKHKNSLDNTQRKATKNKGAKNKIIKGPRMSKTEF